MRKLTNKEIEYLTTIIQDMLNRYAIPKHSYKTSFELLPIYVDSEKTYKIVINYSYVFTKDSLCCFYYHQIFAISGYIIEYDYELLYKDGTSRRETIGEYEYEMLTMLKDNIKEFFANVK